MPGGNFLSQCRHHDAATYLVNKVKCNEERKGEKKRKKSSRLDLLFFFLIGFLCSSSFHHHLCVKRRKLIEQKWPFFASLILLHLQSLSEISCVRKRSHRTPLRLCISISSGIVGAAVVSKRAPLGCENFECLRIFNRIVVRTYLHMQIIIMIGN